MTTEELIQKLRSMSGYMVVRESFCAASQKLSRTTMYPDSCAPQCGTIAGLQAAALYREMVLNYLNSLIKAVNPEMH